MTFMKIRKNPDPKKIKVIFCTHGLHTLLSEEAQKTQEVVVLVSKLEKKRMEMMMVANLRLEKEKTRPCLLSKTLK